MAGFGLEGTLQTTAFQPPCRGLGPLPPFQGAQSPVLAWAGTPSASPGWSELAPDPSGWQRQAQPAARAPLSARRARHSPGEGLIKQRKANTKAINRPPSPSPPRALSHSRPALRRPLAAARGAERRELAGGAQLRSRISGMRRGVAGRSGGGLGPPGWLGEGGAAGGTRRPAPPGRDPRPARLPAAAGLPASGPPDGSRGRRLSAPAALQRGLAAGLTPPPSCKAFFSSTADCLLTSPRGPIFRWGDAGRKRAANGSVGAPGRGRALVKNALGNLFAKFRVKLCAVQKQNVIFPL